MIQDLLMYLTVAIAFGYALTGFWQTLFSKRKTSACSGGCSTGCDIRRELIKSASLK